MPEALSLSWPQPDIALLTVDVPGKRANVLSAAVLDEFASQLEQLESRAGLAGLVIRSGKPGHFSAGADLHEIVDLQGQPPEAIAALCRRGQQLWSRLARLPGVTVAAIDGVCLGGGAELACWCDRRIVTTSRKTQIGFPETKLGLIPGWGGTVRLPRIIGLPLALEMIGAGEPVDSEAAVRMGLATEAVSEERLLDACLALVREEQRSSQFQQDRQRFLGPITFDSKEMAFLRTTHAQRVAGPGADANGAPAKAADVLLQSSSVAAETALQDEATAFATLFAAPAGRALLNVFFLTDRNKRDPGAARPTAAPSPRSALGVIGAGIMGAGIAAAAIKHGLPVVLTDAAPDAVQRALPLVLEEAAYDKRLKAADLAKVLQLAGLLSGGAEAALETCDVVIEAIIENPEVKQQLFVRLEPRLPADAILASNTSTIPITRLAAGLLRPDRFCGLHFFNPVKRMQLVEVIRGALTSDETVATAVDFVKRIGKLPVVVNDGPGFMVNRLLFPYMNEAIELLHDGLSIEQIDRAATAFGMPLGPIALYDMVGLDTAMYAGRTMWEAFPSRVAASPLVPAMVKRGRLGQKASRGFFNYENPRKLPTADPAVTKILDDYTRRQVTLSDDQVQARLFLPMLLEATRLLEENIARDVRDIDLGLIYGLGFPAAKGGLLYWADTLGAKQLREMLIPLEPLGPRMQPTPLLLRMEAKGERFYG